MRTIPALQVVPVRANRTTEASRQEPPTSIWSPGALLRADINGIRYHGSVCYIDDHVDFIAVNASCFSKDQPAEAEWSGTKAKFESTWSFARYAGVG